jgi:hypothetical protein
LLAVVVERLVAVQTKFSLRTTKQSQQVIQYLREKTQVHLAQFQSTRA